MNISIPIRVLTAARRAVELLAKYVDKRFEDYGHFIDSMADQLEGVPARTTAGETVVLELALELEIPEAESAAFDAEVDKLHSSGF